MQLTQGVSPKDRTQLELLRSNSFSFHRRWTISTPTPKIPPKSTTPTRFPFLFPHPPSPAPPQNGSTACDANASLDLHRAIRVGFASIQELREQIVPHAKNVPMAELLAAMDLHLEQPPSAHMVEKHEASVGLFFFCSGSIGVLFR